MSFTVVSFYTENTPYESEVRGLISSLEKFGIPYMVKGIKSLGSWEKNCQHKARVILDAMIELDSDIVWLDADAVVMKYPVLFDTIDCDIGYHYLQHRKELLSGTLFIKNTGKMRALVQQWIDINNTNNKWDQKNLQEVIEHFAGLLPVVLPAEYCKIYDNKMQVVTDPVITHYQASRRFRRLIGTSWER